MTRRILFLFVAVIVLPADVVGQQLPELTQATRLRVTTSASLVQIGTYRSLTDTTLLIAMNATPVAIPFPSVTGLEYSRGRRAGIASRLAGFILGALAGGLGGCAANRDDYGVFCGGQKDSKVVTGAAIGGAAGVALASVVLKREQWSTIDLNELRRRR